MSTPSIIQRATVIEASAESMEPNELRARIRMLALAVAQQEARAVEWERTLWAVLRKTGPALLDPTAVADAPANAAVMVKRLSTGEVEVTAGRI